LTVRLPEPDWQTFLKAIDSVALTLSVETHRAYQVQASTNVFIRRVASSGHGPVQTRGNGVNTP
jgi:hypothetical protein